MRKFLLCAAFLMLLLTGAGAQVTVTGGIVDANSVAVPSANVTLATTVCTFHAGLPSTTNTASFYLTANVNGVIQGTLPLSSDNGCTTPVAYRVTAYRPNGVLLWTQTYTLTGSVLNIGIQINGPNTIIGIGTVVTLPPGSQATVTTGGTTNDVLLNFGLPAGNDGPAGAVGPAGPPGASVRGPQGYPGPPGVSGATVSVGNGAPASSTCTTASTGTYIDQTAGPLQGDWACYNGTWHQISGGAQAPAKFFGNCTGASGTPNFCTPNMDEILPGFSIAGIGGGGVLEIGAPLVNPVVTIGYCGTCVVSSAAITNSDGINSCLAMTSPYSSVTVTGSFVHTSAATLALTVTAVGTSTNSASVYWQWQPRSFGGLVAPGATATLTTSGTNAILSTSDMLSGSTFGAGLSNGDTGIIYGPYVAVVQKVSAACRLWPLELH